MTHNMQTIEWLGASLDSKLKFHFMLASGLDEKAGTQPLKNDGEHKSDHSNRGNTISIKVPFCIDLETFAFNVYMCEQ